MAKAKAATETDDIIGMPIDELHKKLDKKIKSGQDLRDSDLKAISTGSIRLDWALKLPCLEGSMMEIFAPQSVGKAQPLDAKILTPAGFKLMGDLKLGDSVSTPDGKTAKVLAIYPQGIKDIYKVIMSDGTSTECCDEHLWLTESFAERHNYASKRKSIKSLKQIRESLVANTKAKNRNHKIPMTQPVKFGYDESNIDIDAYVLGVLIGDAYLPENSNVRLSSDDDFIINAAKQIGYALKKVSGDNYDYRFSGKKDGILLKDKIADLELSGKKSYDKFIPDTYKFNTPFIRLEIIKGLMDTDGSISEHNGAVEFSTTSLRLAEDVKFIVQSLGGVASIKSRYTYYMYKGIKKRGRLSYRMIISMPVEMPPFKLPRKLDKWKRAYNPTRYIVKVEYVGKKEAQCIYIDSDEHLYITDDFIVTHNTTLALHISKNAMDMGKLVFYLDLEYKLREAQLTMIKGFNRDKFSVIYPDTAEEALEIMHKLIVDFPGCVIILDSVGGLLQEVENAESFEKQGMGGISKLLHKMVRKLTGVAARNKVLLIFLNHLIATMAMYGQKDTTHGGFAIKNRAAQRIELAALASDAIKEGDVKIGQNVRATVVKNNVNRPFIQVYFPIIFGRGIDQELELMEFARDLGLLKYQAKGGWWSFTKDDGSDSGAMRADDLRNILLTDAAFRKSLVDKIMAMAG